MQTSSSPATQIRPTDLHRPQFHFSPDSMWMNDPNGMVYFDEEYHLFYQHYPDSTIWGPMHWGHAVSTDLVHWEDLPIALYPDEKLGLIFSGSAVVDWHNSSGLGSADSPPLIAIFTYHLMEGEKAGRNDFQTQGIAYSTDRGRTWTQYEGNPVIPNPGIRDFRDPKVFWHENTERWVMIFARGDRVRLYTSSNLIDWELASEFGEDQGTHDGVWECPDLFELPIDEQGNTKWVMLVSINPGGYNGGSATQYFIGDFDGITFTNDHPGEEVLWLDYGTDNYAGVTWSDVPASDGRRLFIGWMSNWNYANLVPTERWRSAMTIPRTLSLVQTKAGLRVKSTPVEELDQLRGMEIAIEEKEISQEVPFSTLDSLFEVQLEWKIPDGMQEANFGLLFRNEQGEQVRIGYKQTAREFYIDRRDAGKSDFREDFAALHPAPNPDNEHLISMRIYVDVASVELFAQDGTTCMTDIFFPHSPFSDVVLYGNQSGIQLLSGSIYPLNSIWKQE